MGLAKNTGVVSVDSPGGESTVEDRRANRGREGDGPKHVMRFPEISVVIPTCRRPSFLRKAINSVAMAADAAELTSKSLEILVADDGHCEQSRSVCDELRTMIRHALIYLRTKAGPREGPGAARNQGVRAAKGRFIYFIDDDDQF